MDVTLSFRWMVVFASVIRLDFGFGPASELAVEQLKTVVRLLFESLILDSKPSVNK